MWAYGWLSAGTVFFCRAAPVELRITMTCALMQHSRLPNIFGRLLSPQQKGSGANACRTQRECQDRGDLIFATELQIQGRVDAA
ncbi:uncharacterized protein EI90DRAFT_3044072 [Cantharellus anzutake]|uniref:uncharacterized protein n=1 Tax=Cantharellus anzutake TaxID=1750568 RepID=UPI001906ADB0|nr:uncharacterized protein EI90DRAFT_3044072 [Cantharellus anzutake]KAF8336907.1 hypothetical protein EI90DRAFT_3044072 [Cantharellus anzutake]